MNKIICIFWKQKDWIFNGIGVEILGGIGSFIKYKITKKNLNDEQDSHIQKSENNTISLEGNGNVIGNGNHVTNNYMYTDKVENVEQKEHSWFSKRLETLISLLNDARDFNEKEYTIEYVSSLIGLKKVTDLKIYLTQDEEPDDEFKRKFVDVFGVNEDWMVYGRGEFPFASNIDFLGNNPMDILRKENLEAIKKFIIVTGIVEGKRYACIIKQRTELCYELYPKYFILYSVVGETGATNLVEFYRFLRETSKIRKLHNTVYEATENQMEKLMKGEFSPKKVKTFKVSINFLDLFMNIDEIEENKKYCDSDFIKVQKIIVNRINNIDRINQKCDLELIKKGLEENSYEEQKCLNDVDSFDASTTFFDHRFRKAFPGIRGIQEFTNSKECIDRL